MSTATDIHHHLGHHKDVFRAVPADTNGTMESTTSSSSKRSSKKRSSSSSKSAKQFQELVEHERPRSVSKENSRHHHRRHHHRHADNDPHHHHARSSKSSRGRASSCHDDDNDDEDIEDMDDNDEEDAFSMCSRGSSNSTSRRSHHKHHHSRSSSSKHQQDSTSGSSKRSHHHKKSSKSGSGERGSSSDKSGSHRTSGSRRSGSSTKECIYDCPKMPPVKIQPTKKEEDIVEKFVDDDEDDHAGREPDLNPDERDVAKVYKAIMQAKQRDEEGGRHKDMHGGTLYENLAYENDQVLYDVPRSNRKVSEKTLADSTQDGEAIYMNENAAVAPAEAIVASDMESFQKIPVNDDPAKSYDVPRVNNVPQGEDDSLDNLILPPDYDVPKNRDSLSTIEEEHQEYDVPKAAVDFMILHKDVAKNNSKVIDYSAPRSNPDSIYANNNFDEEEDIDDEIANSPGQDQGHRHHNGDGHSVISTHNHLDDRSSGYRSSSSPSIHSTEDLYVNTTTSTLGKGTTHGVDEMIQADDEAIDSCGSSHKHLSSPESSLLRSSSPHVRDVGVETTLEKKSKKKDTATSSSPLQQELAREKERRKAEEIERDIRRKNEEAQKPSAISQFFDNRKSSSSASTGLFSKGNLGHTIPAPQLDIPNDDFITVGEIAGGSDDEEEFQENIQFKDRKDDATIANSDQGRFKATSGKEQKGYNKPANKAPPVPSSYFPTTATSASACSETETKKKPIKGVLERFKFQENNNSTSPVTHKSNNTLEGKKSQQRDRSVDVYNETIRQRVTSSNNHSNSHIIGLKNVFSAQAMQSQQPEQDSNQSKAPNPPPPMFRDEPLEQENQASYDTNDLEDEEDMPSVRELRSKFETRYEKASKLSRPSAAKAGQGLKSSLSSKDVSPKKSGFLVMSSLTRRGALNMSKSLSNLNAEPSLAKPNPTIQKEKRSLQEFEEVSLKKKEEIFISAPNEFVDAQSIFASPDMQYGAMGFAKKLNEQSRSFSNTHLAPKISPHKKVIPEAITKTMNRSSNNTSIAKGFYKPPTNESLNMSLVDDRGHWRVAALVARLYKLQSLQKDEVEQNSLRAAHFEGILERLPTGKKKSTMWNSWKKQYFVADRGFLQVFSDSSKSSLLERIELFSGKVSVHEDNVLLVEDRAGHVIALRCQPHMIEQWVRVIQASIHQDFARSFVTPSLPSSFTNILVIDFGGASVRAGVASSTAIPTLPQLFFPATMAVDKDHEHALYFGLDAFADEVRIRARMSNPLAASSHQKQTLDQTALQGILEKVFKDLSVEPSDYEIQLSVPRCYNDRTKQAIASMLFEDFGVKSVNMAHQTTFAFYSYNAKSGIMVDLGERMDVVPIVDGYKVHAGVSRSPVGGKELRSKLQHYLLGRNYSLTSFVDDYVTRYAVEHLAYLAPDNFDRELERYGKEFDTIDSSIEIAPETCRNAPVKQLHMGSERFEAPEGLFKPELWGLDQAGIHVLVHKAIKECGVDARREVTQSIFLAGGLTMIPGLRERLEKEVTKLTSVRPRVHASPYRYHAAFIGAMVQATTTAGYQDTKVTREEWVRAGSKLERFWTM